MLRVSSNSQARGAIFAQTNEVISPFINSKGVNMLQRDTFFGRLDEKSGERPQRSPSVTDTGIPATQVRSTLPPGAAIPVEDARKAAKEAPHAPSSKGDDQQGSRLIVGPNIKLKGVEITDCDTLIVEGHVEATMDSRVIQIAPSGTFAGTAGIDVAEIHGGFSCELTARKCLTVHATGKVSGKIRYGKVVIEEGGEIGGEIKKLTDEEKSFRPRAAGSSVA